MLSPILTLISRFFFLRLTMVNSDIRVSVSFKGHRKRKRLKALLGLDATDYILDLWITTAQNHPDGVLSGMDEIDIALEAGWEKDPKIFIDALMECKLLDNNGTGYFLHDWEEHQPWVYHAPARTAKAKHAAEMRWVKGKHATSMPQASGKDTNSNAPSPIPSPKPKPKPKDMSYPEWLNMDLWEDFLAYRKRKDGKLLSEKAITLNINNLRKLIDEGYEQDIVIESAIASNWASFYPPKNYDLEKLKPKKPKQYRKFN